MWNMYASLDSGIRIELPCDPFERYEYTEGSAANALGASIEQISFEDDSLQTFLPLNDLQLGRISTAFMAGNDVLFKMRYTSEPSLLIPRATRIDDTGENIDAKLIGKYKNEYWKFQKEWRYRLCFYPFDFLNNINDIENAIHKAIRAMKTGEGPSFINHYDLKLRDDAIRKMRIVPSPKMSSGNKLLFNYLIEAHGLQGNVQQSQLTGLL